MIKLNKSKRKSSRQVGTCELLDHEMFVIDGQTGVLIEVEGQLFSITNSGPHKVMVGITPYQKP
jgi:hypothetical protein